MNAIRDRLLQLSLRRPFSRKIEASPADVLSDSGSARLLDAYGGLAPRFPLAAALLFLIRAFRGEYDEADRLFRRILEMGDAGAYAELFRDSDLRKLTLGCFKEFLNGNGGVLPRPLAERLHAFARALDPECRRLDGGDGAGGGTPVAAAVPARFEYASRAPKRLTLALYGRKLHFGARSRAHDIIFRFMTAFTDSGAECTFVDPNIEDFEVRPCDLALVDDSYVFRKDRKRKRDLLRHVRERAARVGMVELDPWQPSLAERIGDAKGIYDFIWTMAPALAREGRIHGLPACLIPFPTGFGSVFAQVKGARPPAPAREIKFCGAIEDYNFHRYFWILAGALMRHPFAFEITSHEADGRSVAESLGAYLARLDGACAALSFTMRADGKRLVVGRTFDCFRLGRILVQEHCPDMHFYFQPGVHYLEFADPLELEALGERIRSGSDLEAVRAAGADHFERLYSDAAVVRHVATLL